MNLVKRRRLHNDVFERDERVENVATIGDLEAALTDRTAEVRELESQDMLFTN